MGLYFTIDTHDDRAPSISFPSPLSVLRLLVRLVLRNKWAQMRPPIEKRIADALDCRRFVKVSHKLLPLSYLAQNKSAEKFPKSTSKGEWFVYIASRSEKGSRCRFRESNFICLIYLSNFLEWFWFSKDINGLHVLTISPVKTLNSKGYKCIKNNLTDQHLALRNWLNLWKKLAFRMLNPILVSSVQWWLST